MSAKRVDQPYPDAGLHRSACEKCGTKTRLARREPFPDPGPDFELVSFECSACGHVQTAAMRFGEID